MKRKKRIVLLYAGIGIFAAVAILTSFVRAARTEYTVREVVVQEGDTLWGIWEDVGYGRFDDWVIKVKKMNETDLSVLQPYQRVTVSVVK